MRILPTAALPLILLFSLLESNAREPGYRDPYLQGRALMQAGKYAQAQREFCRARSAEDRVCAAATAEVDLFIALCETGNNGHDTEAMLKNYLDTYPHSIYRERAEYALAGYYYHQGEWEAARQHYAAVDPEKLDRDLQDEYSFRYGHTLFHAGDYVNARRMLSCLPDNHPEYVHASYCLAYMDYSEGNYPSALRGFEALASCDAYRPIVPFYLLQVRYMAGDYAYVTEHGPALAESAVGERRLEILRQTSEGWFNLGDVTKTLDLLSRYRVEGGTFGRQEYYMAGFCYYMLGDYRKAIEYLPRACGTEDLLSQNASYHLADCYLRTGDKQRAMQSFSIASPRGFNDEISEDALFNYGKLKYELGGSVFNEAINVLNRYLELYPGSPRAPQARQYLIAAYYNSHDYAAAYEAIRRFPDPDNEVRSAFQKITYFRALETFDAGGYDQAEKLFRQSLANKFNKKYTALTGYWLGEICYRRGDYAQAVKYFEEYLRLSPASEPEHIQARYNLGYCYFNLRRWNEAANGFAAFTATYTTPDRFRADAFNRLGDIQFSNRSFWKAIEYYDLAAKAGTQEKYYAAYQRALMLGLVDRPQRKIESLQQIVDAGQGNYVDAALYELGKTYIGREQYEKGAEALRQFAGTYPSSPYYLQALADLGLACQNLDKPDQALEYYKMVVAAAPHSMPARDALAGIRNIYVDRNDVNAYFSYAREAGVETDLNARQRDSLTFAAAEKIYLTGNFPHAEKALTAYIEQYPQGIYTAAANYFAADCLLQQDDKPEAAAVLRNLAAMYRNDYTLPGLEKLAALEEELKNFDAAAAAYLHLHDLSANKHIAAEALRGYLRNTVAAGDAKEIASAADRVLSNAGATETAVREAKFAKATALNEQGDQEGAQALYRDLAEQPSHAEGAEAAYRVVERLYTDGNTEQAEQAVFELAEKNSPHAYWVARCFLILGDIYAGRDDSFQARATWQSIVDGYAPADDGVIDQAKQRIKELK